MNMKKAILNIKVNVPDNFKPGNCTDCPFCRRGSYESFPGAYYEKVSCELGFNSAVCPIEIENNS